MEKQIITKEQLIKNVAKKTKENIYHIRDIYNVLEDIIFDSLSSVNNEQEICIRLFEGISLYGKHIPEKTKKNNLTGEVTFVESKVKPKFNITRSYCEKLNGK